MALLSEVFLGSLYIFPILNHTPQLVKSEFFWSSMFYVFCFFKNTSYKKKNTSYKFHVVVYLTYFSTQSIFPPFSILALSKWWSPSDNFCLLSWLINIITFLLLSQPSRAYLLPSLLQVMAQIFILGALAHYLAYCHNLGNRHAYDFLFHGR